MKHPWRHPQFATDPKQAGGSDAEQEPDADDNLSLDEIAGDSSLAVRTLNDPNRDPDPEDNPGDDPP